MIYDTLRNKLLGMIRPGDDKPSFKAEWNQVDPNFILMGSQCGRSFIIHCKNPSNLIVTNHMIHKSEVFGVAWNPHIRDEYVVGCMDGSV